MPTQFEESKAKVEYKIRKVYVYGDGPRDESEESDVAKTRRLVTTLLADATETVFDFSFCF